MTTAVWQPNEPLPGNYVWGYAWVARHRAAAGPVITHAVLPDGSGPVLLCTGGRAIIGNGGDRHCEKCVRLVREQISEQ